MWYVHEKVFCDNLHHVIREEKSPHHAAIIWIVTQFGMSCNALKCHSSNSCELEASHEVLRSEYQERRAWIIQRRNEYRNEACDYNKLNPEHKFSKARGRYFTQSRLLGVTTIICGKGLIYLLCKADNRLKFFSCPPVQHNRFCKKLNCNNII